jgi:cold shock CspA family protein
LPLQLARQSWQPGSGPTLVPNKKDNGIESLLAQTGSKRDAEQRSCWGQTMRGIVKKFDERGSGIIDSADGCKVPFIRCDVIARFALESGQKVVFSVRKVKDKAFAENVTIAKF